MISRKIIRDAFDIQFMLMRGIEIFTDKNKLQQTLQIINSFKERDYKVTLGSILDEVDRKFYLENRFSLLKEELIKQINSIV